MDSARREASTAQGFCAHCIEGAPVGSFVVEGVAFRLCAACASAFKARKELPLVRDAAKGLSLVDVATHIPTLDELDVRATYDKPVARAWRCRQYYEA